MKSWSRRRRAVVSTFFTAAEPIGNIAADGLGNVYATYQDDSFLVKINPQGQATNLLNNLTNPGALAVDGAGNVDVADIGILNGVGFPQVQQVDPTGTLPIKTVVSGLGTGGTAPLGVAVDSQGNIYAATAAQTIVETSPRGVVIQTINLAFTPGALAVEAGGDIIVVDSTDNAIARFDVAGNQTNTSFGGGQITSVALDGSANIYYTTTNPAAGAFELHTIQNFGLTLTAAVGSTSGPGIDTVTNAGNQPLNFSAITVPAPFAFSPAGAPNGTIACSTTAPVVAGTDCQVPVVFTPVAVGPANALATLTDNSLNNAPLPQNFSVQGTGTGVTPVSLTLTGPAAGVVGQSGTYTVTELGAGGVAATGDSDVVSFVTHVWK